MRLSWVPSLDIEPTYTTPSPPGSSVKRPGSSPATIRVRLAATIIASEVRCAHGPSHSEQAAMAATTGTTSSSSGLSMRRGPMPTEASTGISESRYRRPTASSRPSIIPSGRISGRNRSSCRPSCDSIMPAGTRPRAMSLSTSANTPPRLTMSSTTSVANVAWANSRNR